MLRQNREEKTVAAAVAAPAAAAAATTPHPTMMFDVIGGRAHEGRRWIGVVQGVRTRVHARRCVADSLPQGAVVAPSGRPSAGSPRRHAHRPLPA